MLIAASLVFVAACYGPKTTVDEVWTPAVPTAAPPLTNVVTIFMSNNITMRHSGEDQLAKQLAARGVRATPAYSIFHDGAADMRDLDTLKSTLRSMGYDGVVTMRVVDREQNIEVVPGTFDMYWGYWGPAYWGTSYWPGYWYTETIYRIEAAAYSLRTDQLVWSALTRTVDPSSANELVRGTTQVIAGQLTGIGLAG